MKAINAHIEAFSICFRELGKGRFWLYLIPSVIIGIVFFLLFEMVSGIFSFLDYASDVPVLGSFVQGTQGFFSYIGDFIYQFVILTLLSPVYCLLSESVDEKLTGQKFPFDLGRLILDFFRMILIVLLSTVLYFVALGLWWIISSILNLDLLDGAMNSIISAFFFGFSFYDYSLERYQIGTGKSWGFAFRNLLHMILTGLIFTLSFKVPLIGVIIAPFFATIISTIVFLKMHDKILSAHE